MSKLDKMNIRRIIEKVGIPSDKMNLAYAVKGLRDNRELYNETIQLIAEAQNKKEIIEIISDSKRVDKGKLVLAIAMELEYKITENGKGTKNLDQEVFKTRLKTIKQLLEDSDISISDSAPHKGKMKVFVQSSLDLVGKRDQREKKKQKTVEKLNKIKNEHPEVYNEILKNITPDCFLNGMIDDEDIAIRVNSMIIGNSIIEKGIATVDEVRSNLLSFTELIKREDTEKEMERALFEYAEFIDTDKLLLMAMTRRIAKVEDSTRDIEKMNEIKQFVNILSTYIDNKNKNIKGNSNGVELKDTVNLKYIERSLKGYINGIFYGNPEIMQEVVEGLIKGNSNLDDYSDAEIDKILNSCKRYVLENAGESLVIQLLNRGKLEEKDIKNIKQKELSEEMFINLYTTGNLSKEEILDKYKSEEISLKSIRNLRGHLEDKNELNDLVTIDSLTQTFLQKGSANKEYERIKDLFYELRLRERTEEERNEIGDEIISQNEELVENQNLIQLYKERLITLDNAVGWGGRNIALTLFQSGELSYKDTRMLYEKQELTKENLKTFLRKTNIPVVKKASLLNGVFSAKEDDDIRKELLGEIKIDKRQSNSGKNRKGAQKSFKNPDDDLNKKTQKTKKRITDPAARWNLYNIIDSNYTEDITRDGFLVKDMQDSATVVIEPLYKNDKDFTEYARDTAGFFIDREKYQKYKDKIINEKNRVDISFLNELASNNEAVKITHTTRGKTYPKKVARYFLDDVGIQRTHEELAQIEQAAKEVDERTIEL